MTFLLKCSFCKKKVILIVPQAQSSSQNPQGEEADKRLAEFLSRRLLGVYTRNQYLCAD